jgi:uncharacterized Fe-S radical SAM superfamily protein PflX
VDTRFCRCCRRYPNVQRMQEERGLCHNPRELNVIVVKLAAI